MAIDELVSLLESSVMIDGIGQGSGTVIGHSMRNSYVLSCEHVVRAAKKVRVIWKKAKKMYSIGATVERVDAEKDLALIRTATRLDIPAVELDEEQPELCDEVFIVGSPDGYFGLSCRSVLSSLDDSDGYRVSGGVIMPGMSGGGIASDEGKLISVLHAIGKSGNLPVWGVGFGVPLDQVKEFLAKGTLKKLKP